MTRKRENHYVIQIEWDNLEINYRNLKKKSQKTN